MIRRVLFSGALLLFFCLLNTATAFVPAQSVVHRLPFSQKTTPTTPQPLLFMAENPTEEKKSLGFLLDPGTKGGAMFLSLVLFVVPIIVYNVAIAMGADEIDTGIFIGVGFTVVATLAWVSSYLFRVATKDMTYAKQLKDYESAVIAKRYGGVLLCLCVL